ncbi:hypothetical protein RvY_19053 [Ramazzottius varieornatus]|uniref:Uncharacterized protein n=1 Tax=Ramazzottius varieornatus TaxID=947166 RepID=A0A1D1W824_RAMVA|nr:hypothetical protein RvY_19053 [Ramazzottius varieornatus]
MSIWSVNPRLYSSVKAISDGLEFTMNVSICCVLLAGIACAYGGFIPTTTTVKKPSIQLDVFMGSFVSNPQVDFQTNMMQLYGLLDATGGEAPCLWLANDAALSVTKMDDAQCFISFKVAEQEFLGVTVNMDGTPTTSPLLDGMEVLATAQTNVQVEVLSSHLKPATAALSAAFSFSEADKTIAKKYGPMTMNFDLVFPTKSDNTASELVAVITLGGADLPQPVRGELHFQRQEAGSGAGQEA